MLSGNDLRSTLRRHLGLSLVLLLAVIPMGLAVTWGLPNVESWAADDISPWLALRVPSTYLFGWHKYPSLHPGLSLALYGPYLAYLGASGGLDLSCFPHLSEACFSDPYGQLSILMLHSRLLGIAMALGTIVAVYITALRLCGNRLTACLAALIAANTAALVAYAGVGTLDVPQCFWFAVSIAFFAGIVRTGAVSNYLGFGVAAGCALGTKEGIIGAYPVLVIAALWLHVQRVAPRGAPFLVRLRSLRDRPVGLLLFSFAAVYALATNAIFNPAGFIKHWQEWLPSHARMAGFHSAYPSYAELLAQIGGSLAGSLGLPLLLLCGAGVATALWRRQRSCWLLIPVLSYLILSLGLAGYAPLRLLLPVAVLLAIFGGALGERLVSSTGLRGLVGIGLVSIAIAHGFYHSLATGLVRLDDSRLRAESWLAVNVPPGTRIGTLSPHRTLPRLARLGYEVERLPVEESGEAALGASPVSLIVLSQFMSGQMKRSHGDLLDRLEAGELGFTPIRTFERSTLPGEPRPIAKVSPRLVVLQRNGTQLTGGADPPPGRAPQ